MSKGKFDSTQRYSGIVAAALRNFNTDSTWLNAQGNLTNRLASADPTKFSAESINHRIGEESVSDTPAFSQVTGVLGKFYTKGSLAGEALSGAENNLMGMTVRPVVQQQVENAAAVFANDNQTTMNVLDGVSYDFSGENMRQVKTPGGGFIQMARRQAALTLGTKMGYSISDESFTEQSVANAEKATLALTLAQPTMDGFTEAWFPTIPVPANVTGPTFTKTTPYLTNLENSSVAGEAQFFNRIPFITMLRDPALSTLQEDTRMYPLGNEPAYVDYVIPTATLGLGNTTGATPYPKGALRTGVEVNIQRVCFPPSLSRVGTLDMSDELDSASSLDFVYMAMDNVVGGVTTTHYLPVPMANVSTNLFNRSFATDGSDQDLMYSVKVKNHILSAGTMGLAGTQYAPLAALFAANPALANHKIYIGFELTGTFNYFTGNMQISTAQQPYVVQVRDAANQLVAKTSAEYLAIVAWFAGKATIPGYMPVARWRNANFRQFGKCVEMFTSRFTKNVPTLAPVTAISSIDERGSSSGSPDSIDPNKIAMQAVIIEAGVNMAALLSIKNHHIRMLSLTDQLIGIDDLVVTEQQDCLLGLNVRPFAVESDVSLNTTTSSLNTATMNEDIRTRLTNAAAMLVTQMVIGSNLAVARKAMGYKDDAPIVVNILTSLKIATILGFLGDFRTLGPMFPKVNVYCTPNTINEASMENVMYFGLGTEEAMSGTGKVDPCHSGYRLTRPTISVPVKLTRAGSTRVEYYSAPSYALHHNLPISGKLTVTDMDAVINSFIPQQHRVVV